MYSPYEELEYLADCLPGEGESVVITREDGELICKPYSVTDLRDGVDDAELYGFLVQSNERLHRRAFLPLWVTALSVFWLLVILHNGLHLSWDHWYLAPGIVSLSLYAMLIWIRVRQDRLFHQELKPVLSRELARRQIRPYALLAGVRQHGELRTLMDELIRWSPDRPVSLM